MPQILGQGELLEAPPTRKLLVAEGHGAWWGVDPSTRGCVIAAVALRPGEHGGPSWYRRLHREIPFPSLTGGRRLGAIYKLVERAAFEFATEPLMPHPGIVVVEQPSGKTPNLELVYAVGVTIAAVQAGVSSALRREAHVETVASSRWKRVACGRGDIAKPKPSSKEPYAVLTWSQGLGYEGSSWDVADAWGVADYARRSVLLEERL